VNARRKDNWTPLHLASHCAKLEMARLLLDHGANANAEDNLLRTPLHHVTGGQHAVEEDAIRVSQLLIERGADLNAQDIRCETPLHSASSSGRLGLVRVLLAHVAVRNDQDQGPSQLGSEGENSPQNILHSVDTFPTERGVEVDARKTDDWTPLHLAAYFGRPEVTRALLDYGASANAVNDVGETPLYVASRGVYQSQDDGVYIARLLLERGGNVNTQTKDHWTALHAASYFGKPEIVRTLLDQGANANVKNRQGKNSLDLVSRGEYGSEEDGVRVTQFLLERGVDVNASDRDHWTPLHSASYYGRPEIVRTLLDHGAEVNAENDEREPPLNMVSRGKYPSQADGVRIAQLLLDRGADVNARLKGDWTPLNWASYYGRPDLARVLVDHGALVNKKNNFLRTPLHDVSRGEYESQEDGARIARILSERGADIKVEDKNGDTPLHFASSFGRVEIARVLFDHGAIANVANYDGETPLHVISRGKSDSQDAIRLLQLLIERGVDVNALDKDRETPLHTACCFGKLDIARELLDRGATATAKNGRGETPLHVLSRGEYKSQDGFHIARLLLEHGADANAPDMDGDTPLHSACGNGKLDIARQLLTHGAAADVKSIQGETPLHVVSTDGARVARLLLEHGVDVNIHDKNHRTPLGAASFHGNLEIARVLLDHGATADAKDDYGWTALHLVSQYQGATEERGLGVARLLLERGADAQVPDINHVTPLDLASRRGWSKMVQVLLEDGAIDKKNSFTRANANVTSIYSQKQRSSSRRGHFQKR
jgi:ankyrin repeat protein